MLDNTKDYLELMTSFCKKQNHGLTRIEMMRRAMTQLPSRILGDCIIPKARIVWSPVFTVPENSGKSKTLFAQFSGRYNRPPPEDDVVTVDLTERKYGQLVAFDEINNIDPLILEDISTRVARSMETRMNKIIYGVVNENT